CSLRFSSMATKILRRMSFGRRSSLPPNSPSYHPPKARLIFSNSSMVFDHFPPHESGQSIEPQRRGDAEKSLSRRCSSCKALIASRTTGLKTYWRPSDSRRKSHRGCQNVNAELIRLCTILGDSFVETITKSAQFAHNRVDAPRRRHVSQKRILPYCGP